MILFHDFKHHLHSGIQWLKKQEKWNPEVKIHLNSLGSSQLDYYLGNLSPEKIKEEIYGYLEKRKLASKTDYIQWIKDNSGYREISLSDDSLWTLRYIENPRFIHIHPSRYSPFTIRIKSNVLKSIFGLLITDKEGNELDANLMNRVRKELNLSPIDVTKSHPEIEKVYRLLKKEYSRLF